jgi:CheY-like chemotaxis protein
MLEVEVNLLIVDNDPSIRFSLCQIFRHMGHSVRTAEDGFHALQEMNAETPDVLVSDLNMPRMSGFELLSVVRRRFPAIFVVGMTGAFVDRLPEGIAADAWVPAVASRASRAKQVFIGCPECLRAFPQEAEECDSPQEISCFYCQAPISFAVVA